MLIELRTQAGIDLNHARRILSNSLLPLSENDKSNINTAIATVESSLLQQEPGIIKTVLDEFQTVLTPYASMAMDAAAKMYLSNQNPEQLNDLGK